jgi:serine/threonine-protein kinase
VSDAGTALYLLSIASNAARLVEVNLDGVETPMTRDEGAFEHPRYSPDGRYVAYELEDQIWVFDRETGTNDQLTPGGRTYKYPVWSRDGRYVYYASFKSVQGFDGFRRLSDLSGEEEQLYGDERYVYPISASASGDELLMSEGNETSLNLLIMTVGQDSVIFSDYLRADWGEARGTISPDGRWVAYNSNESGDYDIYVRSFPQAAGQVRVSSGGGIEPLWAPDGMAIYFRDPSGSRVMRALVTPGAELRVATPQMLFEGRWSSRSRSFMSSNWDLHPDGDTFLMVTDPRAEVPGSASSGVFLRLVVNWFEELKERVPN